VDEKDRFISSAKNFAKSLWVSIAGVCLLGAVGVIGVISDLAQIEGWITAGGPPVIRVIASFFFIVTAGVVIIEKFQWNRRAAMSAIISILCVAAFGFSNTIWPTVTPTRVGDSERRMPISTSTTAPTTSSTVPTSSPLPKEELLIYHEGKKVDKPIKTTPEAVLKIQVLYTNLSKKIQPKVTLLVKSPSEVEVIRGALLVTDSNEDGQWLDADLTGPALGIGGYLPEGNAIVGFFLRVGDADSFNCGTHALTPEVFLTSGRETVKAELIIHVSRSC
jgi:hypothetical protein